MTFTLDQVVPWGRAFDEYRRMFTLTDANLQSRILGCGDGPASFNAELTAAGGCVRSADPLYRFSGAQIRQRIKESSVSVIEQTRRNLQQFVWTDQLPDLQTLVRRRHTAMDRFLGDYKDMRAQGRYIAAALPDLPFRADSFDLAVCSHFLFLYSQQFSADFHLDAIRSMMDVAREVRIFPLLELSSVPSRHVECVTAELRRAGLCVTLETVEYEFQKGANQMMRIRR